MSQGASGTNLKTMDDRFTRVLGNRTVQAAREEAIRLFGDPATVQTYNWEDEIYRNGASRNFDISASGGTDVTRFFMSGAYELDFELSGLGWRFNGEISSSRGDFWQPPRRFPWIYL